MTKGVLMKKVIFTLIFAILTSVHINAKDINPKSILETLQRFYVEFKGGDELIQKSEGYLVFPEVYKAGLVVGGEYGEGAFIQKGSIISYYKVFSTSIGLQAGAKRNSVLILFLTKEAKDRFLNKEEWKVGVDGNIAVMNWSKGTDLSSIDIKKDTVAIVFNNLGLMANISLEGTVFQRLK
jgi:lipid-binding SYLF domain-containing protein